jgi:UDP-glucose 4-epimerase
VGVAALTASSAAPSGKWLIVGGAGFIGGHLVRRLLVDPDVPRVTVYDNFSSGREMHLEDVRGDPRLTVVRADVRDLDALVHTAAVGHDVVVHLASNPDIARAATEPSIDFDEGTLLTHHVVEAARRASIGRILYASGSGVYGDIGEIEAHEDRGPLVPISTYGASKLAGESLIAAYCFMFGLRGRAFRFGNVVGPWQTHGVGLDFVRALLDDPTRLRIRGDGTQSKSYIHVDDVVEAMLVAEGSGPEPYEVFNVATGDYVTVSEIADLAAECLGIDPSDVRHEPTGGDRGWKGDVPVVRLSIARIRDLGWVPTRSSREALRESIASLADAARAGRL